MGDTKLLTKLLEGDTRQTCFHEHCIANKTFRKVLKTFRKTLLKTLRKKNKNVQKDVIKDVQRSLKAIAVALFLSFVEDSLQQSDDVFRKTVSYIKLLSPLS